MVPVLDTGGALRLLDETVLLRSLNDDYRGIVRVLAEAAAPMSSVIG